MKTETKELTVFETRGQEALALAMKMKVTSPETMKAAVSLQGVFRGYLKDIDDDRDEGIAQAHALHKKLVADKKNLTEPIKQADGIIAGAILNYRQAEIKRIEAENRKAEAEAQKKAQAERDAEIKRVAATEGKAAAKELAKEALVVAPIAVKEATAIAGVSYQKKWTVQVTDFMALVQAVATGKAPITCLVADETALRKFATATDGSVPVAGVKFVQEEFMRRSGL